MISIITYTRENKHKGGHFIQKGPSKHERGQQGCSSTQRRTMDEENNSRSNNVKKDGNKDIRNTGRNQKK